MCKIVHYMRCICEVFGAWPGTDLIAEKSCFSICVLLKRLKKFFLEICVECRNLKGTAYVRYNVGKKIITANTDVNLI